MVGGNEGGRESLDLATTGASAWSWLVLVGLGRISCTDSSNWHPVGIITDIDNDTTIWTSRYG